MHTAELDSAVWCTPSSFLKIRIYLDSAVWCTPRSLTPQWNAHRGVKLRVMMHTVESESAGWCTLRNFLKIRISQRNRNRIWKYFSLFIRVRIMKKKLRSKISWHTPKRESSNSLHLKSLSARVVQYLSLCYMMYVKTCMVFPVGQSPAFDKNLSLKNTENTCSVCLICNVHF